jgi:hypothetical protein
MLNVFIAQVSSDFFFLSRNPAAEAISDKDYSHAIATLQKLQLPRQASKLL